MVARLAVSMLLIFGLTTLVRAEPTTAPSAPTGEEKAAMDAFRAYNDAMAAGDEAGMMKLQYAKGADVEAVSAAMVATDIGVGQVMAAVRKKFGEAAAKMIGKALGDVGNDELATATVRVNGDRAKVVTASGGDGIGMIKVDGGWKFDINSVYDGAGPNGPKLAQMFTGRAGQYRTLAKDIDSGAVDTFEKAMARVSGR